MKNLLYFLVLILYSCHSNGQIDSDIEVQPKVSIDINADLSSDSLILEAISASINKDFEQNTVIRYKESSSNSSMFEQYDSLVPGYKFKFVEEGMAYEIIEAYFEKAKETENYLFLTNLDFDDSYNTYYDIVIAPIPNQLELIRFVGTEPVNYGLDTEDVVEWFKQKETEFDFEIIVADLSRIEVRMTSEPKSYRKLGKEIYEFCPDVIDQGHADMDELVLYLKTSKHMWFWWD